MSRTVTKHGRLARALGPVSRIARRVATERTTPGRTGLAVGIGVVIGCSPFFGFHLAISLAVATMLGLNRAITYLAANVSVPWTAPLIVLASVQAGTLVLEGRTLSLELDTLSSLDPWAFGSAWLVGWLVVGVGLGVPAGLAAWGLTHTFRRRHPLAVDAETETLAAAARAYEGLGRLSEGYVRGKLRHDPVFRQLLVRAPLPSPVLDVGCGRGQTLVLLALREPALCGLGVDWDGKKIALARRASTPWSGLAFEVADVRSAAFPRAGTILMLDILHYSPAPVQDEMLRRAARALAPGGVLFVRDVDGTRSWRATVNRWQERVGTRLGFNRGATLCFRPAAELVAVLAGEGLRVEVAPSTGELPLANVLLEARWPSLAPLASAG